MAEVYTIDGQRYEVEVEKSSDGKQKLVINGQEITLQTSRVNERGFGVELNIVASGKNVELGKTAYEFAYKGPSIDEINAVMKERVARGTATQMERVAVYQQQYNNRAVAEALAKGKSETEADLLKLKESQISGKEPLPDIKKRFPWAYASKTERAKDYITQKLNKDAAYRVKCRRFLEEKKEEMFDQMYREGNKIIIKDGFAKNEDPAENDLHKDLALQEKASKAWSGLDNSKNDEKTKRLVAAANAKQNQEKKASHQVPIQQMTDGHDRA